MTTVILTPGVSADPWICPAGVFTLTQVICTGESGNAAAGVSSHTAGGGAGGGSCSQENAVAVTPGNPYTWQAGTGGQGTDTVFTGDAITVTAHCGGSASGQIAGTGGAVSGNTISFAGGNGGAGGGFSGGDGGGGGGGSAGNAGRGGIGGDGGHVGGGGGGSAGSGTGSAAGGAGENPGGSGTGGDGTAPGGGPGGGKGSSFGVGAGGMPAAGQIILIYTAASNTSVTGAAAVVTAAGSGGLAGVGSAGVPGPVAVSAPAGAVVVAGNWVTFGSAGSVAVACPVGSAAISLPGVPAAIAAAGPAASVRVHLSAPGAVTPAAVFTRARRVTGRPGKLARRWVPLQVQTAQYSAVTPVQAQPLSTWDVLAQVHVQPAAAAWRVLTAVTVRWQSTWQTRQSVTAATPLAIAYAARRRPGHHTPPRHRAIPHTAPAAVQGSAARQAASPPLAWRLLNGVTPQPALTWQTRHQLTAAGYTSWNTAAGTHGVVLALATVIWDTAALTVTVTTAIAAWQTRAQAARTGAMSWSLDVRLVPARVMSWRVLVPAGRSQHSLQRHQHQRRLRRGIPVTGSQAQSSAGLLPGALCGIRWDTRTPVSAPAAPGDVTWQLRAAVTAGTAARWNALHTVTSPHAAAAWDVRAVLPATALSRWEVRNPVQVLALAAWNLLGQVTGPRSLTARRHTAAGHPSRRLPRPGGGQVTWTAATAPLPAAQAVIHWDTPARRSTAAALAWELTVTAASAVAVIRWDITPVVTLTASCTWRIGVQVTVLSAQAAWNLRQRRLSLTAAVTWGIIAILRPASSITWNTFVPVTAATPPLQWDQGQPVQGGMRLAATDEWFTPE